MQKVAEHLLILTLATYAPHRVQGFKSSLSWGNAPYHHHTSITTLTASQDKCYNYRKIKSWMRGYRQGTITERFCLHPQLHSHLRRHHSASVTTLVQASAYTGYTASILKTQSVHVYMYIIQKLNTFQGRLFFRSNTCRKGHGQRRVQ